MAQRRGWEGTLAVGMPSRSANNIVWKNYLWMGRGGERIGWPMGCGNNYVNKLNITYLGIYLDLVSAWTSPGALSNHGPPTTRTLRE